MPSALPSRMHKFLIVSLILIFLLSARALHRAAAADDHGQLSAGAPRGNPLIYVKGKGKSVRLGAGGLVDQVFIFV